MIEPPVIEEVNPPFPDAKPGEPFGPGDLLIYGHKGAQEWLLENGYIISHRTLRNRAALGTGPEIRHWGSWTIYSEVNLRRWAQARWKR